MGKLNLAPEHISKTPSGEMFVKPALEKVLLMDENCFNVMIFVCIDINHFQGILPEILEELLAARKRAKADLKV